MIGVHIDHNLNWVAHVVSKLSTANYVIKTMRCNVKREHLLNIYYALAYSVMTYNVIVRSVSYMVTFFQSGYRVGSNRNRLTEIFICIETLGHYCRIDRRVYHNTTIYFYFSNFIS